ncbi:peptide chain release factor 1 [Candidatus Dojkabacteria bacterium]|nr:peptide chain release factor 1 [Candidatus Dojkabacteria bacterium]
MSLQEVINEIKEEYKELNEKLADPNSIQNASKFKFYSSRLSQLRPVFEVIKTYDKVNHDIEGAKNIIEEESSVELQDLAEQEMKTLEDKKKEIIKEIRELLTKSDPNDARDGILEIRAGTGGEEAALFAGELFRMYHRFAENKGWKFTQLSTNKTGSGGYKEAIAHISGESVFGTLKYENGVHRVQRVPSTESSGRIHTSAVSVVILPEVDDVNIEIRNEDLKIDAYRSSGPGGQSVNTTDSAIRITHIPTDIVVTCQDEKSQHKNKSRALSILKSKLYELEQEKIESKQSDRRRNAIKGGDRSAKIRTYNFPQNRVTDHRIKKSWYNLSSILDGDIQEIIDVTHRLLTKKYEDLSI